MRLLPNVSLAPHTTLGLGGPARWYAACGTEDELRQALAFADAGALPLLILGGGSNLVVADEGFPGVVAHVVLGGLNFVTKAEGVVEVEAGAGIVWDRLVAESVARGLSGVECLSGIPGNVGATPIQNVGAYGQEVADTIIQVECLDRTTREPVAFSAAACGFGYRTSRFKAGDRDRYAVLRVRFRLSATTPPALRYSELAAAVTRVGGLAGLDQATAVARVRDTVLALRRRKSMVLDPTDPESRSVGSFFLNPVLSRSAFAALEHRWRDAGGAGAVPSFPAGDHVKVPAAWLVEQAGFVRGHTRDGVGVSRNHTLALVNRGGTSRALLALADEIAAAVERRFGVRLEREPVSVGGS